MTQPAVPPRLAQVLLRLTIPDDIRGLSIRGDLMEEFRERAARTGLGSARRWYWRQVVGLGVRVFRQRVTPEPRASKRLRHNSRMREMLQTVLQDLQYAFRMIAKRPLPSAVIVVTLGIGIGVNVMFFTGFSAMLLRPLPFGDPDRLVALHEAQPRIGRTWQSISPLNLRDWRDESTVFVDVAPYDYRNINVSTDETPERVEASGVSAALFPLLGLEPVLGRTFRADEDRLDGPAVAMISYEMWERHFRASASAIGSAIRLDDRPHEVIGVMPPEVRFPHFSDIWVPIALDYERTARTSRWLEAVARLKPGATVEQAQTELNVIALRLQERYPETNTGRTAQVRILRDDWLPPSAQLGSAAQQVGVSFVLLIVCANIANLILAQASARRQEMAVRAAMGAGRGRLVRQFLTESLTLALLGGFVGIAAGIYGGTWTKSMVAVPIPWWVNFEVDAAVLIYGVGVSVLTGTLFGILPALRGSRGNLSDTLRSGARSDHGSGGSRLRGALVVVQLSVSVMLVAGSLLLVRGVMRLDQMDRGHDVEHTLTMRMSLAGERYGEREVRVPFVADVVDRVSQLPDVVDAGVVNLLPASTSGTRSSHIYPEGHVLDSDEAPIATYHPISSGYLNTLDVPILAGRGFTRSEERDGSAGVIVSQGLAELSWPGEDPLGRRLRFDRTDDDDWRTVVGVVRDLKPAYQLGGLDRAPAFQIYVPYGRDAREIITLAVRSTGDPASLIEPVRAEIRSADPNVPVFEINTMERVLEEVHWVPRFFSRQFAVFGMIALFIALVGAYSVTAYSVSQRTRELGIRIALGARPTRVLGLVVGQGMRTGVVGAAIGLALAVPMGIVLSRVFQDVNANDPLLFGVVALGLVTMSVAANYAAARKAAQVDPVVALAAD